MAKPKIIMTIAKDGDVNITVNGAKGQQCKELTRDLEAALGTPAEMTRTADWRRKETKTHATQ